jgi:hypothetical protein
VKIALVAFVLACTWCLGGYGLALATGPENGLKSNVGSSLASFEPLARAIWAAEGGNKAKVPYGLLAWPSCKDEPGWCHYLVLEVLHVHHTRWVKAGSKGSFVEYLSQRYCPIGADNDNGTNKFWLKNIKAIMAKEE